MGLGWAEGEVRPLEAGIQMTVPAIKKKRQRRVPFSSKHTMYTPHMHFIDTPQAIYAH